MKEYKEILMGKKLPIVSIDHKWHELFTRIEKTGSIAQKEKQLNELLKRQGKYNIETKDIKNLKKKIMDEIVTYMEQEDAKSKKKVEENKHLIEECNKKLEQYQEELLDLPLKINEINISLMIETMELCYSSLHQNKKEIDEISEWIKRIRIELKKNVVRKQEREITNQDIYTYMHNIFGAEVIDIFDMQYDPLEKPVSLKTESQEQP